MLPRAPWTLQPYTPKPEDVICGTGVKDGDVVLTVPAGRTWQGHVALSGAVIPTSYTHTTTGSVRIATSGPSVVPAAGEYLRLDLAAPYDSGKGTAGVAGTISSPFVLIATDGFPAFLTLKATGTVVQSASAVGILV